MNTSTISNYKIVVKRLREARITCGLNQRSVADRLKKTQSYISKLESGKRKIDVVELNQLAQIYKRDLSYFLNAPKDAPKKDAISLNRVILNSSSLRNNFLALKSATKGLEIFPVLKSNAYGHGILEIIQILEELDPPYFAVNSFQEAITVRSVSSIPVLIMGDNNPATIKLALEKKFTLSATTVSFVQAIVSSQVSGKIHIAINTGMNREGLQKKDIPDVLQILKNNPQISVDGLFSHFADADGDDDDFTHAQEALFMSFVTLFEDAGIRPNWIHLGNSAGLLKTSDHRINACRSGIALYGINPLKKNDERYEVLQTLKPVLRLMSTITDIQQLSKGDGVGYNCTYKSLGESRIGLLPLGYHEGVDRRLSNVGHVKHKDSPLEIVGRISMNMTSIDISATDVQIGDEIVVISEISEDLNSAQNIASKIDTIPYEVLTRIDASLRRVIV